MMWCRRLTCLCHVLLLVLVTQLAMALDRITLPEPQRTGTLSLEQALNQRRSRRAFQDSSLSLQQLSQLLWAAQGLTQGFEYRTAPSAGARYPLELYLVAYEVENLATGIYNYYPSAHVLVRHADADIREALATAAYTQPWVQDAPVVLVMAAAYERMTVRYGERGVRYTDMEVGHAAQNVYLQAESLGLGTLSVGAFDDTEVQSLLQLPLQETPLLLMPIGIPE